MSAKILLKLYDIDGCLYHKCGEPENISSWLIESNQTFLEHEISEIKTLNFDKLIIAYGTSITFACHRQLSLQILA